MHFIKLHHCSWHADETCHEWTQPFMVLRNTVAYGKNLFYQVGCDDCWYYFAWECAEGTCAGRCQCLTSRLKNAQGMSTFLLIDNVLGKQESQKNPFPQKVWSVMICGWCNSLWLPFLILFPWAVSRASSNGTEVSCVWTGAGVLPQQWCHSCAEDFGEGRVRSGLSFASGWQVSLGQTGALKCSSFAARVSLSWKTVQKYSWGWSSAKESYCFRTPHLNTKIIITSHRKEEGRNIMTWGDTQPCWTLAE